jgi:hypothetical protein
MIGQIDSLLQKGVEAARAGDRKRARDNFIHIIELDQRNEQAWLWLSSVVETQADKEVCLENVLIINPDNTYAAMGLQHLRQQPPDYDAPPSVLPRLGSLRATTELEWDAPAMSVAPPPAVRVCPKCGFHNPGWAYLCDHCGADVRAVNVREAIAAESRRRERYAITLLEAWGGALIFNRRWAFVSEIALASWRRGSMALLSAALIASTLRILTAVIVPVLVNQGAERALDLRDQFFADVTLWGWQIVALVLIALLTWVLAALFTWGGGRLMGGKGSLTVHAHLVAVAISAWVLAAALVATLVVLAPYLLVRIGPLELPFRRIFNFASIALGVAGFIWLAQATRTAQGISAVQATAVAVIAAALGAGVLFALDRLTNGAFTDFVSGPVLVFFLPWLG